jgi:outer membrane protein TolC
VKLSFPLFDRSLSTAIDQADIQLRRQNEQLAQLRIDLSAEARSLNGQLKLIGHSTELARITLANEQRLLGIAKVAFRNGRMTTEDYLRYEVQVLDAAAALYQTDVDHWQAISRQSVLFGDELTGVVQ